ncbi:MAG: Piwi domain-containing protein [Candidatus Nitrosocaldaceae archaeon]
MKYGYLELGRLMFGNNGIEFHAYQGLTKHGPYSQPKDEYEEISILYPANYEDLANKLKDVLENGLKPAFKYGFNNIFKTQVSINKYKIKQTNDYIELPEALYEEFSKNGRSNRFPLILLEKTPKSTDSLYFRTKEIFLTKNIITQIITDEIVEDIDRLTWSIFPLSLQIYAKMGGIPYILYEPLGSNLNIKTILLGIGLSKNRMNQYIGFALLFGEQGEWKILKTNAITINNNEELKSQLSKMFRQIIDNSIVEIKQRYYRSTQHPIHIVIHYSGKQISKEEEERIKEAINNNNEYATIIRIKESDYIVRNEDSICIINGSKTYMPMVGSYLEIEENYYLLFTTGCIQLKSERFRLTSKKPRPIILTFTPINYQLDHKYRKFLLNSVFYMCRMNYSSINNPVNKFPITIKYAQEIAYMLSKISRNNYINYANIIQNSLWFI